MAIEQRKLLFFVTEDWYFVSHRLALAIAAKEAGYAVSVATRVRKHGNIIRAAGLTLIPFENSRTSVNPLGECWLLLRLIALWLREKPDVAHHVAMKPVLYGSIAARIAGTPRVINAVAGMGWLFSSGTGLARWLKPLVRHALGWVLRSGTVLVQNPDDAQLLVRMGISEGRIRRIAGAGVDLQRFTPQPEPGGVPVVLLCARLLWDKGVGEFVAAARLLKERGVEARFVLAGEPDQANPSAIPPEQLSSWVQEGIVEYLGWVEDMPQLLAGSSVVCLPSYYGEGLPKALIEAAAAGRAIVTTDMPGCRDAVRSGDNGVLVPPRDAAALAEQLARLLADPPLRRQMGARGRLRAEQEFGADSVIRQTLALYTEPHA
jgi:glycosyltransferase involved in cell wall biosynthesis